MAQDKEQPRLTPTEQMRKNRQAMINTWLRNLTPDTALQIMGHVLLGQAVAERPELNDKTKYVQFKDEESFDPNDTTMYTQLVYVTSLRDITSEETFKQVVSKIQQLLGNALKGVDPVVARSLRLMVTYAANTSHDVTFTMVWMTAKVKNV